MANEEIKAQNMELALDAAVKLFLKVGPAKTTKVMIAKESGLSRRTIERYFKSETDCVVQVSGWLIRHAHETMPSYSEDTFKKGNYTAAQILKMYMQDVKDTFCKEPRLFICYLEIKTYIYRISDTSEVDYEKFVKALGVRDQIVRIFERGSQDKTLDIKGDYLTAAEYFYEMLIYHLSGLTIKYKLDVDMAMRDLDSYVDYTIDVYCFDKNQIHH
jgi:AcrR family transcriptional regulator